MVHMTPCCFMTQIGRFLVPCGWPAEAHRNEYAKKLHANFVNVTAEGRITDQEGNPFPVVLHGLIADHAFVAPEPVAEVVP